jgi:predicted ATPase
VFKRLTLSGWRQFGIVDLEFHEQLTVLTGANGSGKTSLLNILGRHFDWIVHFVGVPSRDREGKIRYTSGLKIESGTDIGSIQYADGSEAQLRTAEEVGQQFDLDVANTQYVPGLSIPSHRTVPSYQAIPNIPSQFSATEQVLQQYRAESLQRYLGVATQHSAFYWMKEALLAAGAYATKTKFQPGNREAKEIFNGFQEILRSLLPPELGFVRLRLEQPEVVMDTRSGPFQLDAVSGGVSALLDVAWQVFLRARGTDQFVVCFDEPENHLHPKLQRSLIPSLLSAFPDIQFIVATHSPFIVTSVPDSNVYVLRFDDEGYVHSELLDQIEKAATASETLREVLGLEATIPLWVERRLDEIVDSHAGQPVDESLLESLRSELEEVGMAEAFPATAAEIAEREGLK